MPGKSDIKTTPERSQLMASVRQSGTSLELAVRRIVDGLGVTYETNVRDLPGTPDLVNQKDTWAIFVHGCFWHAHQGCERGTIPKRNRDFWRKKLSDNRRRDKRKIDRLEEIGYSVLVVWECELENERKLREKLRRFFTQCKRYHNDERKNRDESSGGQKGVASRI